MWANNVFVTLVCCMFLYIILQHNVREADKLTKTFCDSLLLLLLLLLLL